MNFLCVYDIIERRKIAELETAPNDMLLLSDIRLTKNMRHVIQVNSDGQFFIYEVATNKRLISGVFMDDESILYTRER